MMDYYVLRIARNYSKSPELRVGAYLRMETEADDPCDIGPWWPSWAVEDLPGLASRYNSYTDAALAWEGRRIACDVHIVQVRTILGPVGHMDGVGV